MSKNNRSEAENTSEDRDGLGEMAGIEVILAAGPVGQQRGFSHTGLPLGVRQLIGEFRTPRSEAAA